MRTHAWQQRVMDFEFIFAARKSFWHRLSADSSSQLKWGLPATRNKATSCEAIRPAALDTSSLVYTAWDLGSPLDTVTWYFQLVGAEIRFSDCESSRFDSSSTSGSRASQGLSLWQPPRPNVRVR